MKILTTSVQLTVRFPPVKSSVLFFTSIVPALALPKIVCHEKKTRHRKDLDDKKGCDALCSEIQEDHR